MIIRCAILEGTVAPEGQAAFDALMHGTVVPALRTYPGIRQVRLKKRVQADEGAAAHYMVFELVFDSLAAMDAALASPTRQTVRAHMAEAMKGFNGKVVHMVFDET